MQQAQQAAGSGLLQLRCEDGSVVAHGEPRVCVLRGLGPGVAPSARSLGPGMLLDLSSPTPSAEAVVTLGEVPGSTFLAGARVKLCWMGPAHARRVAQLPRHIQFLLAQLDAAGAAGAGAGAGAGPQQAEPLYALLLPLLPDGAKATLQPAREQPASGNLLAAHLAADSPDDPRASWPGAVYVAAGADPYELCDAAIAAAASLTGAGPRSAKAVPDFVAWLGWCTWDAFYHSVSARGVAVGLQSFRDAGCPPPRWVIIDDGWQHTALDSELRRQQPAQAAGGAARAAAAGGQLPRLLRRLTGALVALRRAVLQGVSTVADRLNWWSVLLMLLRSPLAGVVRQLLRAYNTATSEHSKQLVSTAFNSKFSNLDAGPAAGTSGTAAAADVAAVIAALKRRFSLRAVLAWHASLGYWSGVSPGAAASSLASDVVMPRVSEALTDLEPPTAWSQLVLGGLGLPRNPAAFLGTLHTQLAALGIDGVKVDVQNQLELAASAAGAPAGLAATYHAALEASVARHFSGRMINCMSHNTANLYRTRDSCLARCSDDFYPRLPPSHTAHIAACAFNSLFFAPIVTPDWDMWHSQHPRALLHATARMISGGPVYVSDAPGRHDAALLSRLALPDGRLLQPLLPGRPTRDCLFADPTGCGDHGAGSGSGGGGGGGGGRHALKVCSRNAAGGVLALFNLQGSAWSRSRLRFVTHEASPPAVTAVAAPADVEGLATCLPGGAGSCIDGELEPLPGAWACFQDSCRQLSLVGVGADSAATPGRRAEAGGLRVELPPAGSDVVTFAPLLRLPRVGGDGSEPPLLVAAIGLTRMLNPGGALRSVRAARAGTARHGQRAGSSGSSSGSGSSGGSGSGSGSWVLADGAQEGQPADAAAGAASAARVGLEVSFVGCGELLVFIASSPRAVLLDGVVLDARGGWAWDAASGALTVDVPPPASLADAESGGLEHVVLVVV